MRTRGWGPWKENWYSICSAHMYYDETCERCKAGQWNKVWAIAISGFIYNHCYPLWYIWANRPNTKMTKFLEGHFPNLRGQHSWLNWIRITVPEGLKRKKPY